MISEHGTNFALWSTFTHNTYLPYVGKDFEVHTGHPDAAKWNS